MLLKLTPLLLLVLVVRCLVCWLWSLHQGPHQKQELSGGAGRAAAAAAWLWQQPLAALLCGAWQLTC